MSLLGVESTIQKYPIYIVFIFTQSFMLHCVDKNCNVCGIWHTGFAHTMSRTWLLTCFFVLWCVTADCRSGELCHKFILECAIGDGKCVYCACFSHPYSFLLVI